MYVVSEYMHVVVSECMNVVRADRYDRLGLGLGQYNFYDVILIQIYFIHIIHVYIYDICLTH